MIFLNSYKKINSSPGIRQDNVEVDRGGFVLLFRCRISQIRTACRCYFWFFSAASSPFFSLRDVHSVASLVGDEKHESKNSQLSILRQNFAHRHIDRYTPKCGQVHSLWQPEKLEMRTKKYSQRKSPALLMQKLRHSIFRTILTTQSFSFFFSAEGSQ